MNHRFHLGKENNNNLLTNESLSVSPHLITFEHFGSLEMHILIHERPTRLKGEAWVQAWVPSWASLGNSEQFPRCQLRGRVTERICGVLIEPAPCWEELPAPGHLVINIANYQPLIRVLACSVVVVARRWPRGTKWIRRLFHYLHKRSESSSHQLKKQWIKGKVRPRLEKNQCRREGGGARRPGLSGPGKWVNYY